MTTSQLKSRTCDIEVLQNQIVTIREKIKQLHKKTEQQKTKKQLKQKLFLIQEENCNKNNQLLGKKQEQIKRLKLNYQEHILKPLQSKKQRLLQLQTQISKQNSLIEQQDKKMSEIQNNNSDLYQQEQKNTELTSILKICQKQYDQLSSEANTFELSKGIPHLLEVSNQELGSLLSTFQSKE